MRLVNDEQGASALGSKRGQESLETGDEMRLGSAGRRNSKGHQNGLQQLARFELGAYDLRCNHLLRVQAFQQGAHECGLAGTDLAGDNDETFPLMRAKLQVGQGVAVAPTVEIERRIRIQLKRRARETEM